MEETMDANAGKTALRKVACEITVLTAGDGKLSGLAFRSGVTAPQSRG
jgi:hypothetical protein